MDQPDISLRVRFHEGDGAAFAHLWSRSEPSLRRLAGKWLGGNTHDIDDALQEAAKRAWLTHATFNPSRPFHPWASTILINVIRQQHRSHKALSRGGGITISQFDESLHSAAETPPDQLRQQELDDALRDCLSRLGADILRTLQLRAKGHALKEIAGHMGCSVAGAHTRNRRGLEQVQNCLRSKGFDGGLP